MSLCSSRGTAGLDSRGTGALGRVLSVPTSAHHVPFQETFILHPQLWAEEGLWGLSHGPGVQLLQWEEQGDLEGE